MGYRASGQPGPHTHVSADITDATSAPTASKIMRRDAAGGFQASGAVITNLATIAGPTSANGSITYGDGSEYWNYGQTHEIRVYAYKLVGGQKVYSSTYASASLTDDSGNSTNYTITWSWPAVSGASGYQIWKNYGGSSDFQFWRELVGQSSVYDDAEPSWNDNASPLSPPTPTSMSVGASVDGNGFAATGIASLTGNVQEGSGLATGTLSHAEGYLTQAIGNYSHAQGYQTIARDAYAHAEGYQTDCYGTAAHAEGYRTITSNTGAHAEGQETQCWGLGGHAEGYFSKSDWTGEHTFAGGRFSTTGDAQGRRMVIRRQTANNTLSELLIDGSFQRMVVPQDTSWVFVIWLIARRTDANDETKAWQIRGAIDRNTGNTTALVGTPTVEVLAADPAASAWTVSVEADATNNALVVKVQGENSKTIRWVAAVHIVQVTG
ncbi:hypothetical protein [Fontivita pretiosa]|uniref:hypothetical protein n=1 Tax=Fontivita pretiosa TaxID=2989684 RepID=UPI003D16F281